MKKIFAVLVIMFLIPAFCHSKALKISYYYEIDYSEKLPDKAKRMSGKKSIPDNESGTMTVRVWKDAVRMDKPGKSVFYDFKNELVYSSDDAGKSFTRVPLQSITDFLVSEGYNRVKLGDILGSAGVAMSEYSADELEIAFGIPLQATKTAIAVTKEHKSFRFNLTGKVPFTEYKPSGRALGQFGRGFLRFLSYEIKTHPDVKLHMVKTGKIPEKILLRYMINAMLTTEKYSLLSAGFEKTESEREAGMIQLTDMEDSKVYALAEKVMTGNPLDTERKRKDSEAYINAAIKDGNVFDALLCGVDYSLVTGDKKGNLIKLVAPHIKEDKRSRAYISAMSYDTKEGALNSAEILKGINRSGLKYGHILDILTANADSAAGNHKEAVAGFIKALEKAPDVAGAWKDLGDLYCGGYMHGEGWKCYQAGLYLVPEHPMLGDVRSKKAGLKKAFSEFFL